MMFGRLLTVSAQIVWKLYIKTNDWWSAVRGYIGLGFCTLVSVPCSHIKNATIIMTYIPE